jgi:hypothetical protein
MRASRAGRTGPESGRPNFASSRARALFTLCSRPQAWTGSRTVRPVFAIPREMAWRRQTPDSDHCLSTRYADSRRCRPARHAC